MKMFKFTAVVAFLLFASFASAQELKFGHISIQQLIAELPEKITADNAIQAEAKLLQDRRTIMQDEAEKKYKEYLEQRETMPELVRATVEKEIQDIQQRLENYDMLAQQNLNKKQQDLYQPILEKIQKAIDAVGAENGLIYIFDVSSQVVLYHSAASLDCAPLVKAKLVP
jgi:outer membrane protein